MITLNANQQDVIKHYIRCELDELYRPESQCNIEPIIAKIMSEFKITTKPNLEQLVRDSINDINKDAQRNRVITEEDNHRMIELITQYFNDHPDEDPDETNSRNGVRTYVSKEMNLSPLRLVKPINELIRKLQQTVSANLHQQVEDAVAEYIKLNPDLDYNRVSVELRQYVTNAIHCSKLVKLIKPVTEALAKLKPAPLPVVQTVEDYVIQYIQVQQVLKREIVNSDIPEWVASRMNVTINDDFTNKVNLTRLDVLSNSRKLAKPVVELLNTNATTNHCISVIFLDVSVATRIKCTTLYLWTAWKYCSASKTFFPEPVTSGDETKYASVVIPNKRLWNLPQTSGSYINSLAELAYNRTHYLYKPVHRSGYCNEPTVEYPKTEYDGCIVDCSTPPTHIKLRDWKYYHIARLPFRCPGYEKVLILSNEEYDLVFNQLWP